LTPFGFIREHNGSYETLWKHLLLNGVQEVGGSNLTLGIFYMFVDDRKSKKYPIDA